MATTVVIETGARKAFACAVDWPGWCRSGRDEAGALDALAAYVARYRTVADHAGVRLPQSAAKAFDVVERIEGSGATDFGVPDRVAEQDRTPLTRAQAARQADLVAASWAVFDRVVAGAPPTLRKGPRGGGRDRDAVVEHVFGAEASYARSLGIKLPVPALGDDEAVEGLRDAILGALRVPSDGSSGTERGWPSRYAARRIAWHVLDHAWEIEDKGT